MDAVYVQRRGTDKALNIALAKAIDATQKRIYASSPSKGERREAWNVWRQAKALAQRGDYLHAMDSLICALHIAKLSHVADMAEKFAKAEVWPNYTEVEMHH